MNALVIIEPHDLTPALFADHDAIDKIVSDIEKRVRETATDVTTTKGRKEIKSLAHLVARSKVALDDAGKQLGADLKAQTRAIDVERAKIWDRLEALQAEVRKPLDEFEAVEEARIVGHQTALQAIIDIGTMVGEDLKSAEIVTRLAVLDALPERNWQEFHAKAMGARAETRAKLSALKEAALHREAEAAEMERLRAEQVARERREREERIAEEAAAQAFKAAKASALAEAAAAEERAQALIRAAEKAQHDAEAARAEEAMRADRERAAAAEAAEAARLRADTAKIEAVAAQKRAERDLAAQIEKAERDRRALAEAEETNRLIAIEQERARVAELEAATRAETARREADQAHRKAINSAALAAFVEAGLTVEQGVIAVTAIARRVIPSVRIDY
jgi:hypothetical protein